LANTIPLPIDSNACCAGMCHAKIAINILFYEKRAKDQLDILIPVRTYQTMRPEAEAK
jgi:hypothetical protein